LASKNNEMVSSGQHFWLIDQLALTKGLSHRTVEAAVSGNEG
jgi:hypothetical protein